MGRVEAGGILLPTAERRESRTGPMARAVDLMEEILDGRSIRQLSSDEPTALLGPRSNRLRRTHLGNYSYTYREPGYRGYRIVLNPNGDINKLEIFQDPDPRAGKSPAPEFVRLRRYCLETGLVEDALSVLHTLHVFKGDLDNQIRQESTPGKEEGQEGVA